MEQASHHALTLTRHVVMGWVYTFTHQHEDMIHASWRSSDMIQHIHMHATQHVVRMRGLCPSMEALEAHTKLSLTTTCMLMVCMLVHVVLILFSSLLHVLCHASARDLPDACMCVHVTCAVGRVQYPTQQIETSHTHRDTDSTRYIHRTIYHTSQRT